MAIILRLFTFVSIVHFLPLLNGVHCKYRTKFSSHLELHQSQSNAVVESLPVPLLLTSSSSSSSSSSSTQVAVVSGQKATLTCPLLLANHLHHSSAASSSSSSSSSSSVSVVKWHRDKQTLPNDHRHHVQSNGTLVISSSQKKLDEGVYVCSLADNEQTSASLSLRVIDPPRVGPYEFPADLQVGMKARAMCAVMQGDPPFRFTWTQDGKRIESDLPVLESGAVFRTAHFRDYSMITVDSLTLAHAGNVTCSVENDASSTSQSATLKVNAPPQWLVEPKDSNVVLHQSVRIDCLASGSPKPFTSWKRATGGSPWEYVPIYNSIHHYLHPNGSLSIMSASQSQAGAYICQSTNGYGADIGKLIQVRVSEPPRFAVQSQSQGAQKDQPTKLVCQPDGDLPIRMEWTLLNGTLLSEFMLAKSHQKIDDDDSLPFEIKEIPVDALADEISNDSLEIVESSLKNSGASSSSSSGSSAPTSGATHEQLVSILTIRKPSRDDSRIFVCKASNEFGWADYKVRLLVKEKPDSPEEFTIGNVTELSAELRWREAFNGNTPITNYVVEFRPIEIEGSASGSVSSTSGSSSTSSASSLSSSSSSTSSTSTVSSTTVPNDRVQSNGALRTTTISGFRSNTYYQVRISSQNQVGASLPTSWLRLRTEQSAPESPPLEVAATPTGPNSVKITWKGPNKAGWKGEISGYYIGYRAENSDTDLYKTVESSEESTSGKYESHITNLQRSTVYEAWVQAFNARGTGPRSEVVLVRTLADVPPSAPLLRLHVSTTDSITVSWSSAGFGVRSANDLTLYYRPYASTNTEPQLNGATIIRNVSPNMNQWRDISILEPSGRHTVSGLECGRAYEFFATAHNSVGKSEPSTPLVARTRGDAPTPPGRTDLVTEIQSHSALVNIGAWKHNECPITHFSLRIRPRSQLSSQPVAWSVLAAHHSPRENFILRKLTPSTAYELEITAHSSAGSTQIVHHFVTNNHTSSPGETFFSKMGLDSGKAAYPMHSATSEISLSDYEILLPVISSAIVVVVIVAVACFLCSRDHHSLFLQPSTAMHGRARQPSTISSSAENKVPFGTPGMAVQQSQHQEMSVLKELVRSGSVTMTESHPDSMLAGAMPHLLASNDALEGTYSCLNDITSNEPTSLTSIDHLNHHHLLNSPLHGPKKDLVEMQSFYHTHYRHNMDTFNGTMKRVPVTQTLSNGHNPPTTATGNYALPYDVLAMNNHNSIYGQTRQQLMSGPQSLVQPQSQPHQSGMTESLYGTSQIHPTAMNNSGGVANNNSNASNFNHFCTQKMNETASSSENSGSSRSTTVGPYESLVPALPPPPPPQQSNSGGDVRR